MLIQLVLVLAVVLVAAVAVGPLRRPDTESRTHRRRRQLSRNPRRTTTADVEQLLIDVVPRAAVRPLMNRARHQGLTPPTLWRWTQINGPYALGLALSAGFGQRDFSAVDRHFDLESLRLIAELQGGGLASLVLSEVA